MSARSVRGVSVGRGMQTAAQVNALPACHARYGFCICSVLFLGLLLLASVPLPGLNAVQGRALFAHTANLWACNKNPRLEPVSVVGTALVHKQCECM